MGEKSETAASGSLLTATRLVERLNSHLNSGDGGSGMAGSVEIRRCNRKTGEILDDDEGEESERKDGCSGTMTQADHEMRMGQLARYLSVLTPEEKLEWALQRKTEGNELFAAGDAAAAVLRYLDATVGLDFGSTPEQSAAAKSLIQVPVLTNLAACYVSLRQWDKVVRLCNEAIDVDAECSKAHLRKARALIELERPREARNVLARAEQLLPGCARPLEAALQAAVAKRAEQRAAEKALCQRMLKTPKAQEHEKEKEKEMGNKGRMTKKTRTPGGCCALLHLRVRRFLEFRTDPHVKFD